MILSGSVNHHLINFSLCHKHIFKQTTDTWSTNLNWASASIESVNVCSFFPQTSSSTWWYQSLHLILKPDYMLSSPRPFMTRTLDLLWANRDINYAGTTQVNRKLLFYWQSSEIQKNNYLCHFPESPFSHLSKQSWAQPFYCRCPLCAW